MTRPNLVDTLTVLEYAELVRALEASEYIFKHALVQDTAYTSLLKQERKRLHYAIGVTLEEAYATHADEFAAELARHFSEAGEPEKTFAYAERAGDAAARVFALTEAQAQYQNALDAAERLPDTPPQRRARVDVIVKLVAVSLRDRGPEASLERLRTAEELLDALADEVQDRERLARVHFWMGDAYSHLNQQQRAISYLQQVLDAAKEGIADETLLAIPSNVIGRALVAQGKFAQAEPLLAQAAPLLEKSANWYEWVLAVGFLGFARAAQGRTEAALNDTARAFARANELGTPIGMGDSHIFTSFIYQQRADYDAMLWHATAALEAAQQVNDHLLLFIANGVRAWAHTRLGNYDEAERHFAEANAIAQQMGGQVFFADLFQAAHAELALRQGNYDEASARAQRTVETARAAGSLFSEGLAWRIRGQARGLAEGTLSDEGRLALDTSIALFERGGAHLEMVDSLRLLR